MADEQQKKGHGCFFYGCFTILIFAFVLVCVGAFGIWKLKNYAFQYTDTKPAEFPGSKGSQESLDQTRKKLNIFATAMKAGQATAPLTLTAEEINALINNDKDFEALKGKVYVALKDDTATGMVSIPLERMLDRFGKGRYLNGSAAFDLSVKDGRLFLSVVSLEVNGKQMPAIFMNQVRNLNLAENANRDPQKAEQLKQIKSLAIKDGTLFVEAQPGP